VNLDLVLDHLDERALKQHECLSRILDIAIFAMHETRF
jgi:hypothetical protein